MSADPSVSPVETSAPVDLARSVSRSFALHVALRALETLAVGWLACACVLATISVSTHRAEPSQAWAAGVLAWICCGAAWWIEHTPARAAHLRAVDRRLGFEGALVTADGLRAPHASGAFAAALVARVAARLRRTDMARASLPRTPLVIVAALAGTAVLFAARDAAPKYVPLEGASSSAARMQVASQALAASASALRAADAAAAGSDASRAKPGAADGGRPVLADLASALEHYARDPERATGAERDLERRLLDAAHDPRSSGAQVQAAKQALAALDLARKDPRSTAPTPATDTARLGNPTGEVSNSGAAGPTSGTTGAGATGAGSAPASSAAVLASPGSDGRMVAPQADAGGRPATGDPGGPEHGVGTLRWWPARYDQVVQSWLEPARPPKHP